LDHVGEHWEVFVAEENAPDSWIDKQVGVQVGPDVYNGQLVAVNDRGVILHSALNETEILAALEGGEEPEEPLVRLCFFPWRSVQAIVQLGPTE
jgi:hypothetical protein